MVFDNVSDDYTNVLDWVAVRRRTRPLAAGEVHLGLILMPIVVLEEVLCGILVLVYLGLKRGGGAESWMSPRRKEAMLCMKLSLVYISVGAMILMCFTMIEWKRNLIWAPVKVVEPEFEKLLQLCRNLLHSHMHRLILTPDKRDNLDPSEQSKASKYFDKLFNNKRNGTFLEAGGHDGYFLSNTYYLEKKLGWTGVMIEPAQDTFQQLIKSRRNIWASDACITDRSEGIPCEIRGFREFVSKVYESASSKTLESTYDMKSNDEILAFDPPGAMTHWTSNRIGRSGVQCVLVSQIDQSTTTNRSSRRIKGDCSDLFCIHYSLVPLVPPGACEPQRGVDLLEPVEDKLRIGRHNSDHH
ncbi:unnamed protein product [Cyprideis torosa]|uniref:Uncharacterized protein n=1 Tax=Cyprideis torosa TaxID=163714 RepID=A0A7R8WDY0_9CRUS|nr:unnamed protein product [Cyprideis torosa]CAG0895132.1 unnamed protein product [Cyprideis torosa]